MEKSQYGTFKREKGYSPPGRIIKVRDMRPGYAYTFADISMEDYAGKNGSHKYSEGKGYYGFMDNVGLMQIELYSNPHSNSDVIVQLDPMVKDKHFKRVLTTRASDGWMPQETGKIVWRPKEFYRVRRPMNLDDDIIEVYPFRIGIYKEGYEMELIPDPDTCVTVSADTPHSKKDDYVDVWDRQDAKIICILSAVSFVMFLGGPTVWGTIVFIWLLAAMGFRTKHKRIREEVLREREARGVRGSLMDDEFRWR